MNQTEPSWIIVHKTRPECYWCEGGWSETGCMLTFTDKDDNNLPLDGEGEWDEAPEACNDGCVTPEQHRVLKYLWCQSDQRLTYLKFLTNLQYAIGRDDSIIVQRYCIETNGECHT